MNDHKESGLGQSSKRIEQRLSMLFSEQGGRDLEVLLGEERGGHCSSSHPIGQRTSENEPQCAQAYLLWLLPKIQSFSGGTSRELWRSNN